MKRIDLTGRRFGRLLVLEDSGKRSSQQRPLWKCLCDCGNVTYVASLNLTSGNTKSCRCLQKETTSNRNFKHGRSKNKGYHRESLIRRKYGLSIDEEKTLKEKQHYRCAICNIKESEIGESLSVDHDHKTLIVRGLLCRRCNTGLGGFKDKITSLEKAIEYLKKANKC